MLNKCFTIVFLLLIGLSGLSAQFSPDSVELVISDSLYTERLPVTFRLFVINETKEDSILKAEYMEMYSYDAETQIVMTGSAVAEQQYGRFFDFLEQLIEEDSLRVVEMMKKYALSYTNIKGKEFGYDGNK